MIHTKRLDIVLFRKEHLTERYVHWLNDSEVNRFTRHSNRKHTLDSCREYYQSYKGSPNYFWAIEVRRYSRKHIGNINAIVNRENSVADIGILIGEKSEWGRGYASEAWLAVCDFLLRIEQLRKITAGALSINKPMVDLMKRTKMKAGGIRKREVILGGKEVDVVFGCYFREEWGTIRRYFKDILEN